jgi:hypothetical protein
MPDIRSYPTPFACLLAALWVAPLQAAELPAYLPADSEILVSVNVRQVVDSPLFKAKAADAVRQALAREEQAKAVLADLGFDPLTDLDRILAMSPGGAEEDRGLVVFQGRFDTAKFKAVGKKAMREHPEVLKSHTVTDARGAKVLVYEVRFPDPDLPLFVAVADAHTILASPGKDYVVDALKKIDKKGKPAFRNKAFGALVEKLDLEMSVSLAAVGSALTRGGGIPEGAVRNALNRIAAVGGGVKVEKDIEFEVMISAKDEVQARQLKGSADGALKQAITLLALATSAQPELNPVFEMVRSVRVRLKGQVVTIRARVEAETIEELFKKGA